MGRTARALTAWGLVVTVACLAVAIPLDLVAMIRAASPARAALGALVATVTIAPFVGLLLAVVCLASTAAAGALARQRSLARHAWPAVSFPVGFTATWLVVEPTARLLREAYIVMCVAGGVCATAMLGLCAFGSRRLRRASGAALLLAAIAFDSWLNADVYRELHDLAIALGLLGATVAIVGAQPRWSELRAARLAQLGVGSLVAGGLVATSVTPLFPGWRSAAFTHAHYAPRLVRLLRASTDLDRDGFSAIAWGGDCDDLDADRRPGADDPPGGHDTNCNGVSLPAVLEAHHTGLSAPTGVPTAVAGEVELVLLVTIDTMRLDALSEREMPRLAAHASRALRFEQLYAGGTRTAVSLRRILHTGDHALPALLARAGITTEAIVPRQRSIAPTTEGFGVVHDSAAQVDAEITNLALARVRAGAGQRRLVWVHYYAPHPPFESHADAPARHGTRFPKPYSSELHYADSEVGRLLDTLTAEGHLDHAVVIATADHGIGLAGDAIEGYARGADDVVARVPGFIAGPGFQPGRHPYLATHRDIPPTVLGAFGVGESIADAERFGRSWLRLRSDPATPLHEFVITRSARYSSGAHDDVPLALIVTPRYKLVFDYHEDLGELYDRAADPDQREDLAAREPALARKLRTQLGYYDDADRYP